MARGNEWFRRTRRGIVVSVRPADATVLLYLFTELRDALSGPSDSEVMQRLFPRAYLDPTEERRETEFSVFVGADLLRTRLDRLTVVTEMLESVVERRKDTDLRLDDDAAAAWMGALNDARLALGVAIGVTEDLEVDDLDPSDERFAPMQFYALLSWVLGELVDVLLVDLPEVPDDPDDEFPGS